MSGRCACILQAPEMVVFCQCASWRVVVARFEQLGKPACGSARLSKRSAAAIAGGAVDSDEHYYILARISKAIMRGFVT
jgi:hypothetical protein